jgi:2-oxoglutarate ferredoxin oxidoreductase subunit beta
MQAGFVARGFSGEIDHLSGLIQQGISHRGFALIDILQTCISFNKVNTFAWYKKRCYVLSSSYDPTDWETAMRVACEWGDKIPIVIIYRNDRLPFEEHFPVLRQGCDQNIFLTIRDCSNPPGDPLPEAKIANSDTTHRIKPQLTSLI